MILERVAARVLQWAKALLDESVPAERLRVFLADALAISEAELSSGKASLPPQAEQELRQARAMAVDLGILSAAPAAPTAVLAADPRAIQQAEEWLQRLKEGKAVGRAGLTPGAGAALLASLDNASGERREFLESSLEALLRHVETRRRAGLRLVQSAPGSDAWMEWLAVAILLARAARRQGDLRLLNAALKLNDWAFPVHRRMGPGERLARYLLSLAEQETALAAEGMR